MKKNITSLNKWIDEIQISGFHTFTREKAFNELELSEESLKKSLFRLNQKGRILRLRNSFYVIVPLEYRSTGTIPPDWFINDLMRFLNLPYYVGCLSAAAVYGAAHQRPQEMQVVVPSYVRMIDLESVRIRFLQYSGMNHAQIRMQRTQTGDYFISTAEWTAIDLIRFQKNIGGLDTAAGVLQELGEMLDIDKMAEACRNEPQNAPLQRLGWILEHLGFKKLTVPLRSKLAKQNPSYISLNPTLKQHTGTHNSIWHIIINDKLEIG